MIPVGAHPLGEVHLHGKDTDILGTGVWGRGGVERNGHGVYGGGGGGGGSDEKRE